MDNIKNVFEFGMPAVEVVVKITEINSEISTLGFFKYRPTYNLKEIRKKRKPLLSRLIYHNPAKEEITLYREVITPEQIRGYFIPLKKDYVLGVISRVRVRSAQLYLHIPMMDFQDKPEIGSLSAIKHFLQEIGLEGVILFSGRSYHFYGTRLMTENERLDFMGDCMLSGLADPRYIAHSIKDLSNVLRLSACPLRPNVPEVVSIVTGK